MSRRFQFSSRAPFTVLAAIGLLLAVLMLPEDAQSAYVQWFVAPVFVVAPLGLLLLLPACSRAVCSTNRVRFLFPVQPTR